MQVLGDKVDYRLPAMDYEFKRKLKVKADTQWVDDQLKTKVEQTFCDMLLDRINKIEEMAASTQRAQKDASVAKEKEAEDEEKEEEEAEVSVDDDNQDPDSPTSP